MIAVQSLGEIKSQKAVAAFASMLESENDFYVIREMITSLKKIGSAEGMDLVRKQRNHPSWLVRKFVRKIIEPDNRQEWFAGDRDDVS